jgi:hypothetical protein
MSTIKANAYLDSAGGNTATINGATPVGTDTTQTLTNKSIDAGQLTGNVVAARVTTALNASGSAPIYACRAWVTFTGTSGAIRASGNVSSITTLAGTGQFTVNFTTAMQDANYMMSSSGEATSGMARSDCIVGIRNGGLSAGSVSIGCSNASSNTDFPTVCVAIFR